MRLNVARRKKADDTTKRNRSIAILRSQSMVQVPEEFKTGETSITRVLKMHSRLDRRSVLVPLR